MPDVTIRNAEERMKKAVAALSHEFSTPAGAIASPTETFPKLRESRSPRDL